MVSIFPSRPAIAKASSKHRLVIEKVHCIDETGGNWFTERGKDDIYLGGVSLSLNGVEKISYFKVGGFDDGDKRTYRPAKEFATFDQGGNSAVIMVLVEKDAGKQMQSVLDDLVKENQNALNQSIRQFQNKPGFDLGNPDSGDVGSQIWSMLIREAILLTRDALIKWYKKALRDEIFRPQTIFYSSSSAVKKMRFTGYKGTYDVYYRWIA